MSVNEDIELKVREQAKELEVADLLHQSDVVQWFSQYNKLKIAIEALNNIVYKSQNLSEAEIIGSDALKQIDK